MHIGVPSGIGDFAWIWSKLYTTGETFDVDIADGWPHRTRPFIEALPKVGTVRYADFQYGDILSFAHVQKLRKPGLTWGYIKERNYGVTLLECNQHLELGNRIEDWLPDLETEFHFPLGEPTARDLVIVDTLFNWSELPRPWIGVSAASYRGSEAWATWDYDPWSMFLRGLKNETGGSIILLGGFWDDLTYNLSRDDGLHHAVGKTSARQLVEVLRRIDRLVTFASGMGVINCVLGKPTFMLYAKHHAGLAESWVDPAMVEDGTYAWSHWIEPTLVKYRVEKWLGNGSRQSTQDHSLSQTY